MKGPGYWVFAPARLPGGSIVVVNRGFAPLDRKDPATRPGGAPSGIVDIVGAMRWPETRGLFTPADDIKPMCGICATHGDGGRKRWPRGAVLHRPGIAGARGRLAVARKLEVNLRDNHLQYAITWFGLALAFAGVYVVWLAPLRRRV